MAALQRFSKTSALLATTTLSEHSGEVEILVVRSEFLSRP